MITIVITIKIWRRKITFIPLMIKKKWASKPSSSPKEKLELGKVLKAEIGEIRVIALLIFDLIVLLTN